MSQKVGVTAARLGVTAKPSGVILNLGRSDDLIAEIPAEIGYGTQVHTSSAHQGRKFDFDRRDAQQTRFGSRLEFDEQIDVTVRAIGPFERRSEKRELADVIAPAQRL